MKILFEKLAFLPILFLTRTLGLAEKLIVVRIQISPIVAEFLLISECPYRMTIMKSLYGVTFF